MEIAYRYDCLNLNAPDPAIGPDPWAGLASYTLTDQAGNAFTSKMIWVWVKDADCIIRFSHDGIVWGDDIKLWSGDQPIPIVFNAQSWQIQNDVAASIADVQVFCLA